MHIFILTLVYIVAAVSLRAVIISGQFPLAHAAYMGIGAYVAGLTSRWLGWQPWLTIPLGALVTMAFGMLIGYPFARLRALYYAMASLFFGIGILQVIYAFGKWTGSYSGLSSVDPLFSGPGAKMRSYYFFLALTVASLVALYRFEFCRIGISLKAIAQSHSVASSVGINEAKYRIIAVGVGCFFVGLVGGAYAHYNLVVSPSSFNLLATLWLVMYVLVGGAKRFAGPIIGTAFLMLIPEFFRSLKMYTPYISAGILLLFVFVMPQGLVGLPQMISPWFAKRRHAAKGEPCFSKPGN